LLRGESGVRITSGALVNDSSPEVRGHAAFWLAHTGAARAEDALFMASRQDRDDHVREEAIFALSQLPDERATAALIRAAEDQSLAREQRKRALFWLAQSQSSGALAYLDEVLAGNIAR
jgi:HEAT repeat protein